MFIDYILKIENLFCFSLSLLLCYSLFLSKKFHSSFSNDVLTGPQKIHIESTIRIAGFAVFLSLILSNNLFISKNNEILNLLLLTAFPVFSAGFLEDVTNNVSISKRLISSLISGILFIFLFDTKITHINIYFVDLLLQNYIFSLIVTILAISVLINAFNLIDGLHGLSIGTFLIMLLGFSIISVIVEDLVLLSLSLTIMMCFLGAFVINFPLGKFFIGDGGAYSGSNVWSFVHVKPFRTTPSIDIVTGSNYYAFIGNASSSNVSSVFVEGNSTETNIRIANTSASVTQGRSYFLNTNNSSAFIGFEAEL